MKCPDCGKETLSEVCECKEQEYICSFDDTKKTQRHMWPLVVFVVVFALVLIGGYFCCFKLDLLKMFVTEKPVYPQGVHDINNSFLYLSNDDVYYYDFASGKSYLMEKNIKDGTFDSFSKERAYLTEDHKWIFYIRSQRSNGWSPKGGTLICRSANNPDEKPIVIDTKVDHFVYYDDCGKLLYFKKCKSYNNNTFLQYGEELYDPINFDMEMYEYDTSTKKSAPVSDINISCAQASDFSAGIYQTYLGNGKYLYIDNEENLCEKEFGKSARIIDNRVKEYKANPDNTIVYRKDTDNHAYLADFVEFDVTEGDPGYDEEFVNKLKTQKYTWYIGEIYCYDGSQSVLLNSNGHIGDSSGWYDDYIYATTEIDYGTRVKYSELDPTHFGDSSNDIKKAVRNNQKVSYYIVRGTQGYEVPITDELPVACMADDLSEIVVISTTFEIQPGMGPVGIEQYYKTTFENGAYSDLIPVDKDYAFSKGYTQYHTVRNKQGDNVLMTKIDGKEMVIDSDISKGYPLHGGGYIYIKNHETYIWKDGKTQKIDDNPIEPEGSFAMISDVEYYHETLQFAKDDYNLYNVVWYNKGNICAIIDGEAKVIVENVDSIKAPN